MPPKFKLPAAVPAPKKKSPPKEPGVENLTTAVSKKLKVTTPPPVKKFSIKTDNAHMVKLYTQKNVDFVEVDIHVAGPLPEHGYKVDLSPDGMCLIWRRSVPNYFFESKLMVAMLGRAYHPDESRVIAHDNVVQKIQKGGTENNGLHFAPEEEAMIVPLGIVCTSDVRVKETLQKVDEVVHNGYTHYQFNTIYSCKVQAMVQRKSQKKKAWRSVHIDLDQLNEGEDSDGYDDNEGDEEMADQVGSRVCNNNNGP
jgi:hypothetical protein